MYGDCCEHGIHGTRCPSCYPLGRADRLAHIHQKLYQMRYNGAMDEGQDLRTCIICVTNSLLDLMSYMREQDESK